MTGKTILSPLSPFRSRQAAALGCLRHYRSRADMLGFAGALALMIFAAILLRLVPSRFLLRPFGASMGPVGCVPVVTAHQAARAALVQRSIRRAVAVTPLRSNCLPQALAGRTLCQLLGVPTTTHLGVRLRERLIGERRIEAHAWVCSGPVAVTGGYGFDEFVSVACFASPRLRTTP